MLIRRILWVAILFLTCGVSSAYAQFGYGGSGRNWEITPFGGGRFHGVVNLPNSTSSIDYLTVDSSYDYGVMGDVDILGPLQAEFMWSRQPTSFGAHDFTTGVVSPVPNGNVNVDVYQWSLLYPFRDSSSKLRPYIAGGIGFTHWGVNNPNLVPFTNNLSFNLGGGVKYFFSKHYGLRADFRWIPSRTTSQLGQFCDPIFGCYAANQNNYAQQMQANIGLILRF